jgi:hypothetical protein
MKYIPYIPAEVLFHNPSFINLDLETLQNLTCVDKEWRDLVMPLLQTENMYERFNKYKYITGNYEIKKNTTVFNLVQFEKFLMTYDSFVPDHFPTLIHLDIFSKNTNAYTFERISTTFKILLTIQEYTSSHASSYKDTLISLVNIYNIHKLLDIAFQTNIPEFINHTAFKSTIHGKTRILLRDIYQKQKANQELAPYKKYFYKVTRLLRHIKRISI